MTKIYTNGDEFIALSEPFTEMPLHDTYGNYGNNGLGCSYAESDDLSIFNPNYDLEEKCKDMLVEKFGIDKEDIIFNTDGEVIYYGKNENAVRDAAWKFEDENSDYEMTEAYNYWNGSNYATLYKDDEWEDVDDELSEKLIDLYNNAEFHQVSTGIHEAISDGYKFRYSQWETNPYMWTAEKI